MTMRQFSFLVSAASSQAYLGLDTPLSMTSFHLEPIPLHPTHTLHLLLLQNLSPAQHSALLLALSSRSLDVAALDPALIPSPRCLAAAAAKALLAEASRGRTTAATLHGDLVRCLHGGKSVNDAHKALAPRGTHALLAVLNAAAGIVGVAGAASGGSGDGDASAEAQLAQLAAQVGGTPSPLRDWWGAGAGELGGSVDAAGVAAVWRVSPAEAALGVAGVFSGLEAAVLQRIGGGSDA